MIEPNQAGENPGEKLDATTDSTEEASSTPTASQEPSQNTTSSLSEAELKKRIQELENQIKEKESKFVYLYAEFENFKKRAIKERSDSIKFGWEPVARDLLLQVDNLERALSHTPSTTDKALVEGLHMVLSEIRSSLQKQGVQIIESLQKEFDPHLHEAVGQESADAPAGTVIKEFARGYTLHGRLLRPSQVVISAGRS